MLIHITIFIALVLALALSVVSTGEPAVHKRTMHGIEQYACFLINETKLFITVSIDGRKMGILKPIVSDDLQKESVRKIWLSAKPHALTALGFNSMNDFSRNMPSFKTDIIAFDISAHIDRERKTDGSFRVPAISVEEMHFKPIFEIQQRNGHK